MTTPRKQHDDLAATLAARQELGPEYDAAFVEKVVERLEQTIDVRMGAHTRTRSDHELAIAREDRKTTISVAAISLGVSIPLTGIAVGGAGVAGLLIAWIGLVLINVAYAVRGARRHR